MESYVFMVSSLRSSPFMMLMSKAFNKLAFWLETIFLFTKSDYKTIFFPVVSALGCDTSDNEIRCMNYFLECR